MTAASRRSSGQLSPHSSTRRSAAASARLGSPALTRLAGRQAHAKLAPGPAAQAAASCISGTHASCQAPVQLSRICTSLHCSWRIKSALRQQVQATGARKHSAAAAVGAAGQRTCAWAGPHAPAQAVLRAGCYSLQLCIGWALQIVLQPSDVFRAQWGPQTADSLASAAAVRQPCSPALLQQSRCPRTSRQAPAQQSLTQQEAERVTAGMDSRHVPFKSQAKAAACHVADLT